MRRANKITPDAYRIRLSRKNLGKKLAKFEVQQIHMTATGIESYEDNDFKL